MILTNLTLRTLRGASLGSDIDKVLKTTTIRRNRISFPPSAVSNATMYDNALSVPGKIIGLDV